jgi:hypothetical protein
MLSLESEINLAYLVRDVNCMSPLHRSTRLALVAHVTRSPVVFVVASVQYFFNTLSVERRVVWSAPASFAKYAYPISRYFPILGALVMILPLSGYLGYTLTNSVRIRA